MTQITNKLLKQAIADAEAVRETAVANAKLVLEEAITPQIRDMISRRLRVEAEMADDEDEGKESAKPDFLDADKDGDTKEPMKQAVATKAGGEMKKEATSETPWHTHNAAGHKDFPADDSEIGKGDNKEPSDDAFDSSDIGTGPEANTDSSTDWYDDWSESDFDLDEVIRELEEDIAALSHKDDDSEKGEYPEGEPAGEEGSEVPSDSSEIGKGSMKETESAMDTGKYANAELKMDGSHMNAEEDDEEIDLEEILAELEADDAEMGDEKVAHDAKTAMADKLARLKGEMAQYREAVNILRDRLQEVNLLNAKLLFTNKMFHKNSLTNEQKVRIVESFDRATTVREVKIVYTTLVENLSAAVKTFNASRKKVVTEGLASKAVPSTAPKSQQVIVENTVAKRLQELAGII
jgi:hypothetical protein